MLLEFIQNNLGWILAGVFTVLAGILVQRKLAWWTWVHEVLFFAWDSAEKRGLIEGIKGEEKLRHYLDVYRLQYMKKWGELPTEQHMSMAAQKAAELSAKEKIIRLADPTSPDPTLVVGR